MTDEDPNRPIRCSDFREVGYCVAGQRAMAKSIGIDWRDFVKNGITLEEAAKHPGITAMVADVLRKRTRRG